MRYDRSGIIPCPKCEVWADVVSDDDEVSVNYSDANRCQDKPIRNCGAIRGAIRAYLAQ